jgi:hypothetical protein
MGDLTAEGFFFNEKNTLFGSAGVQRGGQTRRACADDDDIVHIYDHSFRLAKASFLAELGWFCGAKSLWLR